MKRLSKKLFCLVIFTLISTVQLLAQKDKSAFKRASAEKITVPQGTATANDWTKLLNTNERLVEITTDYGVMIAKLYDSTPLHRDNFIKLVENKFYDSLLFHRVINQFMIQGGDPLSKSAGDGVPLGNSSAAADRIPAEFKPYFLHKKGALAAARDNNPEKASSNCQFYIVQGKTMADQELEKVYNERVKPSNPSFSYNKIQKEIYNRIGGVPFLDQSYTVFGEVISGLDIIDKIARVPKDASDRPLQNVRMKIRILN